MSLFDIQMILILGIIFICFLFVIHGVITLDGNLGSLFRNNKNLEITPQYELPSKKNTDGVYIGKSGKRKIYLPENAKHIYICGTTGSGKTVAIANFISYCIEHNYPCLITDGKGDTGDNSLLDIVMKLKGNRKLYLINLNSPQESDKYNPFKGASSTVVKDMLINLSEWSEEHYKLNVERYLQRVIELMQLSNIPLSLETIIRHISVDNFLLLSKKLVTDKKISKEEDIQNRQISKSSGAIVEGAVARFSTLIESDIGTIFSANGIDIFSALQENAIILFILNPLLYPIICPLFGRLIITDCKKAVSKLYSEPLTRRFFIFDEINVYASTPLLDLVNKSRSAEITCILASQSLSDLSSSVDDNFKEQVIENCNNYIILRQNSPKNAEEWSNIVGTRETVNVTYQLDEDGASGKGSVTQVREYVLHPDTIKFFRTGEGFILSKDFRFKCKIKINKPI